MLHTFQYCLQSIALKDAAVVGVKRKCQYSYFHANNLLILLTILLVIEVPQHNQTAGFNPKNL